MSAQRQRKPVEAGDGSYGGKVLAAFDAMGSQGFLLMGTPHVCPSCGLAYNCEEEGCLLGKSEICKLCLKWPSPHSDSALNVAKRDPVWAAKLARINARLRNCSPLLQIVQPKDANPCDLTKIEVAFEESMR